MSCDHCLFKEKPLHCNTCPVRQIVPEGKKPPLGIAPRYVLDELRARDIREAILRYLASGLKIPLEWVEEYNELIEKRR